MHHGSLQALAFPANSKDKGSANPPGAGTSALGARRDLQGLIGASWAFPASWQILNLGACPGLA